MTKVSGSEDIERLDLSKKTVKEVVAELARHYEALRAQPGMDRLDTSFSASLANQGLADLGAEFVDQPSTSLPPLRGSFDPLPADNLQFAADTGQPNFDRRVEPSLHRAGGTDQAGRTGDAQEFDRGIDATESRRIENDADLHAPVDGFNDLAPPPLAHAAGSSLSAYAAAGHQQQMAPRSDSRRAGFGWGMFTGILMTLILAAAAIWLMKSPLADRFPVLQLLRTNLQPSSVAPSSSGAVPKTTTDGTSSQSSSAEPGQPETITLPTTAPASPPTVTAPASAAVGAPTGRPAASPQPVPTSQLPVGSQSQIPPVTPTTPASAVPATSSTTSAKPAAAATTTKKSGSKTASSKTKSTSPKVATSKKKSTDPLTARIKPKPFNPADVSTFPTAAGTPTTGASATGTSQPAAPNSAPANAAPTSLLPSANASGSNP
jgi:hypothetical protein